MRQAIIALLFIACIGLLNIAPVNAEKAYAKPTLENVMVEVHGLVCDFCARAIEKVMAQEPSVNDVIVDLGSGEIRILLNSRDTMDDARLTELVQDAGYSVAKITRKAADPEP